MNEEQQQFLTDTRNDAQIFWTLAGDLRQRARLYEKRYARELAGLPDEAFKGKKSPAQVQAFYQLIGAIDTLLNDGTNENAIIEML